MFLSIKRYSILEATHPGREQGLRIWFGDRNKLINILAVLISGEWLFPGFLTSCNHSIRVKYKILRSSNFSLKYGVQNPILLILGIEKVIPKICEIGTLANDIVLQNSGSDIECK